jgi:hypothetical protein
MLEIGFVLKLCSNTVPVVPPSTGNVPRKYLYFILVSKVISKDLKGTHTLSLTPTDPRA